MLYHLITLNSFLTYNGVISQESKYLNKNVKSALILL